MEIVQLKGLFQKGLSFLASSFILFFPLTPCCAFFNECCMKYGEMEICKRIVNREMIPHLIAKPLLT